MRFLADGADSVFVVDAIVVAPGSLALFGAVAILSILTLISASAVFASVRMALMEGFPVLLVVSPMPSSTFWAPVPGSGSLAPLGQPSKLSGAS